MKAIKILDSVSQGGASQMVKVTGMKELVFVVHTEGNADAVVNFVGSFDENANANQPQSEENDWHFLTGIDVSTGSAAIAPSAVRADGSTDVHKAIMINAEGLQWVGVVVSNYVSGEITAKMTAVFPKEI